MTNSDFSFWLDFLGSGGVLGLGKLFSDRGLAANLDLERDRQRLYENHVTGKLGAERFAKLSEGYEKEQADLKHSAEGLRALVNAAETQAVNIQSILKIVKKYTEPTELTPGAFAEVCGKGSCSCPG